MCRFLACKWVDLTLSSLRGYCLFLLPTLNLTSVLVSSATHSADYTIVNPSQVLGYIWQQIVTEQVWSVEWQASWEPGKGYEVCRVRTSHKHLKKCYMDKILTSNAATNLRILTEKDERYLKESCLSFTERCEYAVCVSRYQVQHFGYFKSFIFCYQ